MVSRMSLHEGYAEFRWFAPLSDADKEDVLEWLDIIRRQVERSSRPVAVALAETKE